MLFFGPRELNTRTTTAVANDPNGEWALAKFAQGLFDERGRPLPHPPGTSQLLDGNQVVARVEQRATTDSTAATGVSEQPKQFYFKHEGNVVGPMTGAELRECTHVGNVVSTTLVATDPHGEWVVASHIRGLFKEYGKPLPHPNEGQRFLTAKEPADDQLAMTPPPANENQHKSIPEDAAVDAATKGLNRASRKQATWYYQHQGSVIGPLTGHELREAALAQSVLPVTLVANNPNGPWDSASRVGGLFSEVPTHRSRSEAKPGGRSVRRRTVQKVRPQIASWLVFGVVAIASVFTVATFLWTKRSPSVVEVSPRSRSRQAGNSVPAAPLDGASSTDPKPRATSPTEKTGAVVDLSQGDSERTADTSSLNRDERESIDADWRAANKEALRSAVNRVREIIESTNVNDFDRMDYFFIHRDWALIQLQSGDISASLQTVERILEGGLVSEIFLNKMLQDIGGELASEGRYQAAKDVQHRIATTSHKVAIQAMIIEGLAAIRAGEHPNLVGERLDSLYKPFTLVNQPL